MKSIRTRIIVIAMLLLSPQLFGQGYEIDVVLQGSSRGHATLRLYHRDGNEQVDSTQIDAKGRFSFRGPVKETIPALLTINSKRSYRIYISPENTINIEIKPGKKQSFRIKGSPMTEAWQALVAPDGKEDKNVHLQRLNNWVNNHPDHLFSPDLIATYLAHAWDYETLQRSLNTLQGEALNTYHYRRLQQYLSQLSRLQAGSTAPEFTTTDQKGKSVRLSSISRQHNYTLLSVWAASDKTCRATIPAIAALYKQYKAHGLEILGISIDQDPNTWKQAIKADNISWLQANEPQAWNGPVLKAYNIKSIPAYVLINRQNKIELTTDELDDVKDFLYERTKQQGYRIDGSIDGIDEGIITMDILAEGGKKTRFQSRITNGLFSFEGYTPYPCMASLHLPAKGGDISFFMDNEHISISGSMQRTNHLHIEGSPTNDGFQQLSAKCNNRNNPMQCLMNYALEQPASIYTPFIISSYLAPYLSDEDLASLVSSLTGAATNMYQYALLQEHVQTVRRNEGIGERIADLVMPNQNGKEVRLLDEASKSDYTLVNLWAPWEQKSVNAIKQLRNLYKKYDKQRLNIISISLDDNATEWHSSIKALGMHWCNLSEHKRWNSGVVKLYNVDSIPQYILIDRNGVIISKTQSVESMLNTIDTKLANKTSAKQSK